MVQNIQLFIDGKEVEFSTPPDILYTYQITDMTNPTAIKNSYSKSITVEGTKNNNDLFGHIWNVERTQSDISFNPSKKASFELYANGSLYESGYVRLYEARLNNKKIEYSITLYGGLGDFFYNLTFDSDGNELTLNNLHYMTGDTNVSSENEFDFDVNKETLYDAWVGSGPDATGNTKWRYINFAPCYNGIPENFDADKVLMNFEDSPLPEAVQNPDNDDKYYTTLNGWSIGEAATDLTEWETRDIRSYLQRPVIRVKEIINACCNKENNGGYDVVLDSDFFNSNNPYWEDTWMTLPLINDLEYGETKDVYTDSTLICGEAMEMPDGTADMVFSVGSFSQDTMGNMQVTGQMKIKTLVTDSTTNLYTSYINFGTFGKLYREDAYMGCLFCQMIAYNGDNVVGVSNTISLTSRIYNNKKQLYFYCTNNDVMEATKCPNAYTDCFGHFTKENGNTYVWVPDSGGRDLSFNINNINTNVTNLKMRFIWGTDRQKYDFTHGYGRLFVRDHDFGGNYAGFTAASSATMSVTSKNFGAIATTMGKTGTHLTKRLLLGNTDSPADYLIGYAKLFGLYFLKDLAFKKIYILTRNNFYNNPDYKDLSRYIDRSKDCKINPLTFEAKYYDFQLDMDESQFSKKYEAAYKNKFGCQVVNTGYEFGSERVDMLEKIVYKGGVEALEKSKYFTTLGADNYFKPYMLMGFTYKLWLGDDEYEYPFNGLGGSRRNTIYGLNQDEELKYYDIIPKLVFHDKSNKGTDGSNVLCFFNGYKDVTQGLPRELYYYITDDVPYMQLLNEESCWLFTNSEYDRDGNRIAIRLTNIPVFERYSTDADSGFIKKSLDYGSPRELYVPYYVHMENSTLYDQFWKTYINDMFSINSRRLECYVRLIEKPNPEWLRSFFWFDNAIWRLNEISDWSVTEQDMTRMEFIKVMDTNNYTSIQPNRGSQIRFVLSKYLIDASGETITGTITAPDGFSWHIEYPSAISVSPLSGNGNGTITIVVPANPLDGQRRSFNLRVVGTGAQARATLQQKYEGEGAFVIKPRDIVVPYSGGTYILDVDWKDKGANIMDSTYASDSASSLSYTADTQTSALTNNILLTVAPYSGDTIITNYARFNVSGDTGLNYTIGICQLPEQMEFAASGETRTIVFPYMHSITITDNPFWFVPTSFTAETHSLRVTAQNNLGDERGGYVEVSCETNSERFTAIQAAGATPGLIDPEILVYEASGGSQTLNIGIETGWRIVGRPDWITVSSSADTGATAITVTASENKTANEKTGGLAILDTTTNMTYAVMCTQSAGTGTSLYEPEMLVYEASGGTQTLNIGIPSGWTITSVPSWITVSSSAGTGSTTIQVSASANTFAEQRTNAIALYDATANTTYSVVCQQAAGSGSTGPVDPLSLQYAQTGETKNITINIPGEWRIVGRPSWITLSQSAGTGNTVITATAGENTGNTRDGYIAVLDVANNVPYAIQAIQTGPLDTPSLTVTPDNQTVPVSGGTYTTTIHYNQRNGDTITITPSSTAVTYTPSAITWSNDDATIYVSIAPNAGGSAITHTITYSGVSNQISAQQVFVQAYEDYANVDRDNINFGSDSGTTTINISSNVSWTATTDDSWLTFNPTSGSGSTVLSISAAANTSTESRTGYIYIRKTSNNALLHTITVKQGGVATILEVNPNYILFEASGGTASITITSNTSWIIEEI